jgi:hypothetical protein
MRVTVYLSHNVVPRHEVTLMRCVRCNRPMFKFSANEMTIANTGVSSDEVYLPNANYIEFICRNCLTNYQILFQ